MGWYQPGIWREFVEAFDEWWLIVTQYLNDDGLPDRIEHPVSGRMMSATYRLGSLSMKLLDLMEQTIRIDPMPIWDVYLAIDDREKRRFARAYSTTGAGSLMELVPMGELYRMTLRVQPIYELVQKRGISSTKPSDGATVANRNPAPPCPECGGKCRVASSGRKGSRTRNICCQECGHKFKEAKVG